MELVQSALERLGHLFYIVNPFTTSFRTKEEVPHYVSDASLWFFALIIMEHIVLRKKKGKMPPVNDSLTSIACGMFMEINQIAFKGAQTAAYVYLYENYRMYDMPWNSLWTWLACAIAKDFCYYWAHRAAHEVNLFWSQHQVHHSSEEYNLSTALRQGVWQGWYMTDKFKQPLEVVPKSAYVLFVSRNRATFFFDLPMAFFLPPSHYFVHSHFNLLYQFWIHTEVIDDLGPLEWILNTPSHHRVHHGSTKYCIDKNYAGVLIIWDRIFGTFEAERRKEPMVYGLVDQVDSFNPFYLEFFYLKKVYQKMTSMTGAVDKFKAVFFGPGWFPGTERLGNLDELPDTTGRTKFSKPLSSRMQIYAGVHFLILSEAYRYLAGHYDEIDSLTRSATCAYIIVSLVSLGLLFNQSSLFPWLEMTRCILLVAYSIYYLPVIESFWLRMLVNVIRFFYLMSAWMCKMFCFQTCRAKMLEDAYSKTK